jgi:hypothetical protein
MRTRAGLWIDHRKAVIVTVTDKGDEIRQIISKVEKHPSRSGDSPLRGPYEARQVPADDSRQRRLTGQLNIYYDAVISCIRSAEAILIFGPGEAKSELKKRLARSGLAARIVGVETADKMTVRQIAAKIRK